MFHDPERTIEFEFVRTTENAASNAMHWVGCGDKESADAAVCDAIYGVFDLVDISGEVVIGEGIKGTIGISRCFDGSVLLSVFGLYPNYRAWARSESNT